MAQITISKWEIAKLFGLKFHGQVDTKDYSEGDYKFSLADNYFTVDWMYEDTAQEREGSACERAAEKVLTAIGKAAISYL